MDTAWKLWVVTVTIGLIAATAGWLNAKTLWTDALGDFSGLGPKTNTTSPLPDQFRFMNWHPILMMLSFGTLGAQAVVTFKLVQVDKYWAKMIHGSLHLIAVICSSIGIWVMFWFKYTSQNSDLYTVHSYVGLAAFVLYLAQFVMGFISFGVMNWSASWEKASLGWRTSFVHYHRFFGFAIWMTTLAAICTGLAGRQWIISVMNQTTYNNSSQPYYLYGTEYNLANSLSLIAVLVGWTVVYSLFYAGKDKKDQHYEIIQ